MHACKARRLQSVAASPFGCLQCRACTAVFALTSSTGACNRPHRLHCRSGCDDLVKYVDGDRAVAVTQPTRRCLLVNAQHRKEQLQTETEGGATDSAGTANQSLLPAYMFIGMSVCTWVKAATFDILVSIMGLQMPNHPGLPAQTPCHSIFSPKML